MYAQLPLLGNIRIERKVVINGTPTDIQLHGFCDASEKGYGACIYLRSRTFNEDPVVKLLCAKPRVAPLKEVSLPRLELCGALLLVHLLNRTILVLNLSITAINLWTDSTIVLSWFTSPPGRWKTFVANRVTEIQEESSLDQWRHVPSAQNPADLISRGVTPEALVDNNLWWRGPSWLSSTSSLWPSMNNQHAEANVPEQRKPVSTFTTFNGQDDFILKFSNLSRLQRVLAYVLRFLSNTKLPSKERETGALNRKNSS